MKKHNKYIYGYKIYLNYGQGWEYELFEKTWKDAQDRRNEYIINFPQYHIKICKGRELNDE